MKEIGFEKEYFLLKKPSIINGEPLDATKHGFPVDECGYLVEARGEPNTDYVKAVYSLLAEDFKLKRRAEKLNLHLIDYSFMKVKPSITRYFLRKYGKHASHTHNMYGKSYALSFTILRAGLHIHFSDKHIHTIENSSRTITSHNPINIPLIIRHLDTVFIKQIKKSKRIQGEYEMKAHGFEYRSLPTSISLFKAGEEAMNVFIKS